jgi:hypothetical protein
VTLMQKHFTSPREYAKWLRTHPTRPSGRCRKAGQLRLLRQRPADEC